MRNRVKKLLCTKVILLIGLFCFGQSSANLDSVVNPRFFIAVSKQAQSIQGKLDKKTDRMIHKWQRKEARLRKKVTRVDSIVSAHTFSTQNSVHNLHFQEGNATYIPKIDSFSTSLDFLSQHPGFLPKGTEVSENLQIATDNIKKLREQFGKAEYIKDILKKRKQFLKEQLSKLGFAKELKRLNKEVFYYSQQITEYKDMLKNSKKLERKTLELLSKTRLFRDFMRRNSQLASLFRLPDDQGSSNVQTNFAGLQTRVQVNSLIQQQISAAGPGASAQFRQNIQAAQAQLNQLKAKISEFGGSSSDEEMPNFKPNTQRSKSFWKRLELGTNVQTQKATYFFPVTSDIGLSVGYKLNDKSIIGVGSSVKMGWGRGFRDIQISSQGVGLRSFVDYKLKGSFWISGGFEMNYRDQINNWSQLQEYSSWQQSGLIGLSKVVSLKTKFFKKTRVQLLWDFLSYQQVPLSQSVIFRIGYQF